MQQNDTIKIPPTILITIILQILFIVILIVTIFSIINQENNPLTYNNLPTISIDNPSSLGVNLPESYINKISHNLTYTVELNTDNLDIPTSKATIRDNTMTLKEFDSANSTLLSFIVDIPSLEQSYQIYYSYPSNPNKESFLSEDTDTSLPVNPYVLCVTEKSQIIYPNFNCHSAFSSDMRYKIINNYINQISFDIFSISIDSTNPHQINLKPFRRVTTTLNESHIAEVKAAIASLGISPDLFTYHIIQQ